MVRVISSLNGSYPQIEPFVYHVTKADIYSDGSERSAETGRLLLYLIRRNVHTIELEYRGSDSEIAFIEALISDNYQFPVTFLHNGEYVTATMYPSDRTNSTESIRNGKGRHILRFTLIEI